MNLLNLQDSGSGVPSWVWDWLAGLIGDQNALILQSVLMIIVYGTAIAIIIWQIIRMMGAWNDRNHKDVKIREEAKDRIRNGFIIIGAVILIAGIGMSICFFMLNTFLGVS